MSWEGTGQAAWVIPLAGAAFRWIAMVTGFLSISRESATIGGGMVAEKKRVCRSAGIWRRIRLTSGRKPMSSIRSASSRTRISTPRSAA